MAGIPLTSGFTLNTSEPLDKRSVVDTIANRNLIPLYQRYIGMEIFCKEDKTKYILKKGITNSDWEEVGSGTGSGGTGGVENTETSPYNSVYIKDTTTSNVYKIYCNNGVLDSINMSSTAKILSSIRATKTKTIYNMDENILVDDIVVTATYQDGTTSTVTGWYTNVNELDTFTEGLRILNVYYTLDGTTKSTSVYLSVKLSVSCNSKQYITILNETGLLINGTDLARSNEIIYNRDMLNVRFRLKMIVTRNRNTSYTTIGIGNGTYWTGDTLKNVVLLPNQIGEFIIEGNLNISYPQTNTASGVPLLKIYNSSSMTEGKFELEQLSVALTQPASIIVSSISATKTTTKYFASDTINTSDIVVTTKYSDDTTKTVTNFTTNLSSLDLSNGGNLPLTISYTENYVTKTCTVTLNIYKADYTTPQPFTITTAKDFRNAMTIGWNLGNALDSKGSADKTAFGEDRYPNQETAWGQQTIKRETFDLVKAQGFNTIRIPVTWFYNSYFDANGDRRIGKFFKARVREVVDMALDAGFWVILNSHHDMAMFYAGASSTAFQKVLTDARTVWEDLANKFKHYGERLIFEGFNEIDNIQAPWQFGTVASDQMNQMNQLFVNTVRASGSNNANRLLIVPTLLDGAGSSFYDAFVLPTDTVEDRLLVEIHTYPTIFLQNMEDTFEAMEEFSNRINAPVFVGEFGTTNITFSDQRIRPIHASNFIARAKSHNIKCMWWDNGTTKTSPSDYALINRQDNTVKYSNIIDAINNGYNNNIAYKIPDEYISTINSIDKTTYMTLNKDSGLLANTYWGTIVSDFFPVIAGSTLTAMVTRSGAATTDQIALANIVFYNENKDYMSGTATAYQTMTYNKIVPDGAKFVRVSLNSPSKNVPSATFAQYLSSGILELSISNYSVEMITPVDIKVANTLTSITVSKARTVYTVGDPVTVDDINVVATYGDGLSKIVTNWTSNYNALDFATVGDKTLVVSFTSGEITLTKEIIIGIELPSPLSSISATKTKMSYNVGESVRTDDIIVTATYTNNATKDVIGWTSNFDSVDFNTSGDKILTITYTEGEITISTNITITMIDVPQIVYSWDGEENLPTGLVLATGEGGSILVKHLDTDGKYYYSNDKTTYGYGSIAIADTIRPTSGTTIVTATVDVLSLRTATDKYVQVSGYVSNDRVANVNILGTGYSGAGTTGAPELTIGVHSIKIVIHQVSNTFDIYIDGILNSASLTQYQGNSATVPTCLVGLWHTSKDRVKLKSFVYRHLDN
jgi:hypothetical protein